MTGTPQNSEQECYSNFYLCEAELADILRKEFSISEIGYNSFVAPVIQKMKKLAFEICEAELADILRHE